MNGVTESTVEAAALAWIESLGWAVAHGPDIAPDTPGAERADYGQVVLEGRLRDALAGLNPDLPAETLKMAILAEEAGLPRPEILEMPGAVVVRFRRASTVPHRSTAPELSARQREVLDALGPGELLAVADILERLGGRHPRRTVQLDLATLRGFGVVETVGKGRSTRWRRTH